MSVLLRGRDGSRRNRPASRGGSRSGSRGGSPRAGAAAAVKPRSARSAASLLAAAAAVAAASSRCAPPAAQRLQVGAGGGAAPSLAARKPRLSPPAPPESTPTEAAPTESALRPSTPTPSAPRPSSASRVSGQTPRWESFQPSAIGKFEAHVVSHFLREIPPCCRPARPVLVYSIIILNFAQHVPRSFCTAVRVAVDALVAFCSAYIPRAEVEAAGGGGGGGAGGAGGGGAGGDGGGAGGGGGGLAERWADPPPVIDHLVNISSEHLAEVKRFWRRGVRAAFACSLHAELARAGGGDVGRPPRGVGLFRRSPTAEPLPAAPTDELAAAGPQVAAERAGEGGGATLTAAPLSEEAGGLTAADSATPSGGASNLSEFSRARQIDPVVDPVVDPAGANLRLPESAGAGGCLAEFRAMMEEPRLRSPATTGAFVDVTRTEPYMPRAAERAILVWLRFLTQAIRLFLPRVFYWARRKHLFPSFAEYRAPPAAPAMGERGAADSGAGKGRSRRLPGDDQERRPEYQACKQIGQYFGVHWPEFLAMFRAVAAGEAPASVFPAWECTALPHLEALGFAAALPQKTLWAFEVGWALTMRRLRARFLADAQRTPRASAPPHKRRVSLFPPLPCEAFAWVSGFYQGRVTLQIAEFFRTSSCNRHALPPLSARDLKRFSAKKAPAVRKATAGTARRRTKRKAASRRPTRDNRTTPTPAAGETESRALDGALRCVQQQSIDHQLQLEEPLPFDELLSSEDLLPPAAEDKPLPMDRPESLELPAAAVEAPQLQRTAKAREGDLLAATALPAAMEEAGRQLRSTLGPAFEMTPFRSVAQAPAVVDTEATWGAGAQEVELFDGVNLLPDTALAAEKELRLLLETEEIFETVPKARVSAAATERVSPEMERVPAAPEHAATGFVFAKAAAESCSSGTSFTVSSQSQPILQPMLFAQGPAAISAPPTTCPAAAPPPPAPEVLRQPARPQPRPPAEEAVPAKVRRTMMLAPLLQLAEGRDEFADAVLCNPRDVLPELRPRPVAAADPTRRRWL